MIEDNLVTWSAALSNAATTEAELPGIYLGLADLYLRGHDPMLAARPLTTAIRLLEAQVGPHDAKLKKPLQQLAELAARQGCTRQAQDLYARLRDLEPASPRTAPEPISR
jgi:hypothetical protein